MSAPLPASGDSALPSGWRTSWVLALTICGGSTLERMAPGWAATAVPRTVNDMPDPTTLFTHRHPTNRMARARRAGVERDIVRSIADICTGKRGMPSNANARSPAMCADARRESPVLASAEKTRLCAAPLRARPDGRRRTALPQYRLLHPVRATAREYRMRRQSSSCRNRCLAITMRWISDVPSPISQIFASRIMRSTG